MTPKKANAFFSEVSRETGISEEIIEDIINFYWKEIRTVLTGLEEKRILLVNFGTFEAREKILRKMLDKYVSLSENTKVMTYTRHVILENNLKKLNAVKKLLEEFEEEGQKRKQIKERRNAGNI